MKKKKNSASAATAFCEWIQLEIYVYIPHCKDQVKPHSSSWFAAACPAAIAHRNPENCFPFTEIYPSNSDVQ